MEDIYGAYGPMIAVVNPGGGNPITTTTTVLGFMGTCVGHAGTAGLTYSWSKVSGPSATFSNPNISNPTVTWSGPGTYVIGLTIGDGLGGSYSLQHPPECHSGPAGNDNALAG